MWWKFWDSGSNGPKNTRLKGPKQMPVPVGRALVVAKGEDPDWVWSLRCVEQPREGKEGCLDVRVFDEGTATARKISVRNYTSMDQVPELILFEGWYNKKTGEADVEKRSQPSHG